MLTQLAGDCLATGGAAASIPAGVAASFPNASKFEAYIHPNTGHGINFHYNGESSQMQERYNARGDKMLTSFLFQLLVPTMSFKISLPPTVSRAHRSKHLSLTSLKCCSDPSHMDSSYQHGVAT